MQELLTRTTALDELIEISSWLSENVIVCKVLWPEVRPAVNWVGVDVDVNSDTVRHSHTLAQTRLDVRHRE